MTQSELFNPDSDDPSRGHKDENSKAAFDSTKESRLIDRAKVYVLIHESGKRGMTLHQIAWRMGKVPSAVSGRVSQLMAKGMIERKEERGQTPSGKTCWIYVCK